MDALEGSALTQRWSGVGRWIVTGNAPCETLAACSSMEDNKIRAMRDVHASMVSTIFSSSESGVEQGSSAKFISFNVGGGPHTRTSGSPKLPHIEGTLASPTPRT